SLLNPIDITENFTTLSTTVWTGTNPNGQHTGCEDLGNGCGPGTAEYGISTATNGSWTAAGIDNQTAPHSIYAFSSVITAESTATPEPSTFLLLGVTMIGLAGWRIQKTRSA
ncbi:MAG TPA: PEP-CTERM sorting domain-containing protein, partial [Bryobacteraceae bacterium]|nr:PEP-CTERM sorting domain-containing protein [Bryobacteraceae bacterium]